MLFKRLKIRIRKFAAHDTASDAGIAEKTNLYGWNKVVTPPNYQKIYIPFGQGTTFWVSEQLPYVIDSLISYRNAITNLRDNGVEVHHEDLKILADTPHEL